MFAIISWIVFGLIVGALARFVLPGSDPMGWLATLILGVIGSVVGGFIGNLLWGAGDGGFQPGGFFLSLLGAILLLLVWRKVGPGTTVS
jgi:uncharacterized membrane protein YeaQ/YmgE (transglycosylase-associated protein family)